LELLSQPAGATCLGSAELTRALPVGGRSAAEAVAYGWTPRGWARPPPTRPRVGLERWFFCTWGARGAKGEQRFARKPSVFSFPVAVLLSFRSFAPIFLRSRFGYCRQMKIRGRNNPCFNIRYRFDHEPPWPTTTSMGHGGWRSNHRGLQRLGQRARAQRAGRPAAVVHSG
jgi:hypothetical protein